MKSLMLLVGILGIGLHSLQAQEYKVIRVKAGTDARKVIPANERYRYGDFRQGAISFYNGTVANAKLNYSILLGEMHFIDPKGDTLSLANENTIKRIEIGNDLFFYDSKNGFLEVVTEYTPTKLAIKRDMKIVSSEREGAYNQSSGVSSIRTYKSMVNANGQVHRLEIKGDMLLARNEIYFLIDQNNQAIRADKAGIMKVFSKHKKTIETYIKENALDLRQEQDVKRVLRFSSELL